MPHESTFQLQTDLAPIAALQFTKSVSKLGETLSMVLKLKLEV